MKKINKLLSLFCTLAILATCLPFTLSTSAEAADETVTTEVRAAMAEYVTQYGNESTKAGLLAAVRKVQPAATLDDSNYSIYYAQPMAYDNDTESGYPLNIPGNDGGVAAIFEIGGKTVSVACAFEREKELIDVTNIAVAGADDGKLIYDGSKNIIGCAEGVEKIVIPEKYGGTMGIPDFETYPAINSVKTVIIQNPSVRINSDAFRSEKKFWTSLKALNIYSGKITYWQSCDGFFVNARVWGCPALKYLYLPIDTTKNFPKYSFRDLTALETVNVPFGSWYDYGCFYNNGIREYITGGKAADGSWKSAVSNGGFAGGKTVSVITGNTEITPVRAAAWTVAALNEQNGESDDGTAVTNAKAVLQKRAWNSGAYNYLGAATVSFTGDWNTGNEGADTRTITVSNGSYTFQGQLVNSRISPDINMIDGATVRKGSSAGLRFKASFQRLDEIIAAGHEYKAGMLIAPADYLDGISFTADALSAAGREYLDIKQSVWEKIPDETDTSYIMNAVISNIIPSNYSRAFAARAYVDVTYSDGVTKRYYSDYSGERNSESAYHLALTLLNDTENPIDDAALRSLLEDYVKGAETRQESTMYVNWSADNKRLQVVQSYSETEDFVMVIKPTGVNNIMNIAPPRFIADTSSAVSNDLSKAYERSGAENMSESDWLGPHYADWNWYGGTHGTNGEGGDPTGFSDNIKLYLNGKETDAANSIDSYAAELTVTWDTYAGGTTADTAKILEHHTLRFDGTTWHIKTELEFLTNLTWNSYYGMQCVYGVWCGTISYDGGEPQSISSNAESSSKPYATNSGITKCETMLLSKNDDHLEMFLDSGYGLGKREYLGNNSGAFTQTYNAAKNGKAYFSLVKDKAMNKGDKAEFIGSYRFYSSAKLDSDFYNRSVLNEGNPVGIANAMKKAQNGEPVTIAAIGGSITEGYHASDNSKCYASLLKSWWESSFPQSELTFVNAGKGDTDSLLGAYRVADDVLKYNPDFVVVEFSVNDSNDELYKKTYEGLVRQILSSEGKPGVLLLQMMNQNGDNRAPLHTPVGVHYNLPVISYKEAVWPAGGDKLFSWGELSPDTVHPNDLGHSLTAMLITNYLAGVKSKINILAGEVGELPEALTGSEYDVASLYNHDNFTLDTVGTFTEDDNTYQFKNGWTATGSGDAMTFTVENSKHVYILYYQENGRSGSSATVSVNGGEAAAISGDFSGGWNRTVKYEAVNSDTPGSYTVTITPTSESGTAFSVTAILVS